MNPMEMLRLEHREARDIIGALRQVDCDRDTLFEKLHRELEVHAQIEEELFYPALRQRAGAEKVVDDGRQEHDEIRARLATMQEQPAGSAPWLTALEGLTQLVEHHVKDEEDEMFRLAHEHIDKEALTDLAQRMSDRKTELMAKM